jgi:heparin/heparan-sulfate lyase
MDRADYQPGEYHYARGDATRAYQPSKLELFTREITYAPKQDVLVVFDRVRATDPRYRKVWLLHGVNEPVLEAANGAAAGNGGTSYTNAPAFRFEEGGGRLRVHSLLPREREVIKRGGPGNEFWTPGGAAGGDWGSGQNWALEPPEGGPLPADELLRKMWKTFYGENFERLARSNRRAVVPGSWRVEVSPRTPAKEDLFLHVLEIGDIGDGRARRVELLEGNSLTGALVEDGYASLFSSQAEPVTEGEVTMPAVKVRALLLTGLKPRGRYDLRLAGVQPGVPSWTARGQANEAGVLRLPYNRAQRGRLRLRLVR